MYDFLSSQGHLHILNLEPILIMEKIRHPQSWLGGVFIRGQGGLAPPSIPTPSSGQKLEATSHRLTEDAPFLVLSISSVTGNLHKYKGPPYVLKGFCHFCLGDIPPLFTYSSHPASHDQVW